MRKTLLALVLGIALPSLLTSSLALAEQAPQPSAQTPALAPAPSVMLKLQNPQTHEVESLTMSDVSNADVMRRYMVPVPNSTELYNTYLAMGYFPLHALILSNWDINEIMHSLNPGLPQNPAMKEKIQGIRNVYQHAQ
jgi:hypothetical protein